MFWEDLGEEKNMIKIYFRDFFFLVKNITRSLVNFWLSIPIHFLSSGGTTLWYITKNF